MTDWLFTASDLFLGVVLVLEDFFRNFVAILCQTY